MSDNADSFLRLCEGHTPHPNVFDFLSKASGLSAREQIEVVLVDQYYRWKLQQAIPVEHYLKRLPEIDDQLMVPVIVEEYGYLEQRGIAPHPHEFVRRYESLKPEAIALLCEELEIDPPADDLNSDERLDSDHPSQTRREIDRYQVVCSIGQGAFGEVYLAKDPTLDRSVAIKVLSADRAYAGADPQELLREARVIAKLDHPQIVPVFDFGQTEDGDCFIVSKYIKGKDLRSEIRKSLSHLEAAKITAQLAQALQAAHRVGVIHRDVKPANVILDENRAPNLLDFGLALRHHSEHSEGAYAGTPAYMSPEQRRGESVDGRTDIYSLGIVFYEMLARRRPFPSGSQTAESSESRSLEPQPPRQFVESIPRELERICLRALAARPADRYNTAADFAEDLNAWLAHESNVKLASASPQQTEIRSDAFDDKQNGISKSQQTQSDSTEKTKPDTGFRASRKRWWIAGMVAALVLVALVLEWVDSQSALRRWSDTYLPEFARAYLTDGWNLKPDFKTGYFYDSQPLLQAAKQVDPTVVSVAVKTTAPRFKPLQVCWSPQGDRLAVVTRRGQLRIYHFNGVKLELQTVFRAETSNDWVRCFRWHPFDGSAAIATGRGIVIGTSTDRGDYDISLLIGKVYETSSIDCLVDQGRVLYVFGSKTGYRAWDPLTETVYENFLPESGRNFASNGLSNQYVFSSGGDDADSTIEFWEATWSGNAADHTASQQPHHQWRFSRRRTTGLETANSKPFGKINSLELSDDNTHLMAAGTAGLSVFRTGDEVTENLVSIESISFSDKPDRGPLNRFIPIRWPEQRNRSTEPVVVWRDGGTINRYRFNGARGPRSDNPVARQVIDRLSTEMLGDKLRDSAFDFHRSKELIAVAYAGGLEIWNARLQTVAMVPAVDCVWDAIPLQLHDKCVLLRRDGGGVVVRQRGEPLGKVIPPLPMQQTGFDIVQRSSVVEPELHLVQSTYQAERSPVVRSLTTFDIVALTTPSRHTFSLVPKQVYSDRFSADHRESFADGNRWNYATTYDPIDLQDLSQINRRFHQIIADATERTAIAQRAQKVVLCDHQGSYTVRRLKQFDEAPRLSGRLNEIDQYLSVEVDPDATTLYAGVGGPNGTVIRALDLATGTHLWKQELKDVENGVNLAWLNDRVLVTSWFGWRWIDARWGEVLSDASPREKYGIRHGQIRKHALGGTLFSWHRYGEVEPAAAWSKDLDLQWFAFAAGDGQWLILSAAGELIAEVTSDVPLVQRFVGSSPEQYQPATWDEDVEVVIHKPTDSLTLVRYHSDGRTTCRPFVPLESNESF